MAKTTKTTKATSKKLSGAKRGLRSSKIPTGTLMETVYKALVRKGWVALGHIDLAVRNSSPRAYSRDSITARIRDLRKPQFGGFKVECRPVAGNTAETEYRLS